MEKHEVEEARAKGAKQRDTKIEELLAENKVLEESNRILAEKLEKKERQMADDAKETKRLSAGVFKAHAEVYKLTHKMHNGN